MSSFPSIRIEGGLLGPELLDQVIAADVPGQKPAEFGLEAKRNLTDEIAAAFADSRAQWGIFKNRLARLPEDDLATTVTRDTFVIPFLGLLGYELTFNARAHEVDGMSLAVSHGAGQQERESVRLGEREKESAARSVEEVSRSHALTVSPSSPEGPPVHIVGARQELGRVPPSGRPRLAPHSLVQEYLNRTEHVWGVVTNGLTLRLLRDSTLVRRQAYIEFDLQAIFEEQRFHDFAALYRLLHRSRLPRGMADSAECLLERYFQHSKDQGGRVREHLRDGVKSALETFGNGLLAHTASANAELIRALAENRVTAQGFYQQLLRLIYRLLFLMVSEERNLLVSRRPEQIGSADIYRRYYSITRLRRLVDQSAAYTEHDDIWHGLRTLFRCLQDDQFGPLLALPALNGELFAPLTLDGLSLRNRDFLTALWHLSNYADERTHATRHVNYSALDVEELGSVYESLLEFHPHLDLNARPPSFELIEEGGERRSTGSHYTPPELVAPLIKHALEPVLQERLAAAAAQDAERGDAETRRSAPVSASPRLRVSPSSSERAILSLKVCDLACGSGHFLLAAARRLGKELARVRTGEDEPAPERVRESVRDVITHCIYGVDKNPLAVELCRVALWLEGHAEDKPLTFLDHRIRCGDSLVGVFDLKALEAGIPDEAFKPVAGDDRDAARAAKTRNVRERRESLFRYAFGQQLQKFATELQRIDALPEDTIEQVRVKADAYRRLEHLPEFEKLELACNVWTAAFFQRHGDTETRRGERADSLRVSASPLSASSPVTTEALRTALSTGSLPDKRLAGWIRATAHERAFFHWPLAFPEVFAAGGFDVFLGNPPFLGGLRISTEFGDKYRQWLSFLFQPFPGTADICAAFFRRAFNALNPAGRFGLIATNTISQGDSREGGLGPIKLEGGIIAFAKRFVKWPGQATVEVNLVAVSKRPTPEQATLDGVLVSEISSRFDAEPEQDPQPLHQSRDKCFIGDFVRGIGFVVDRQEAENLLSGDSTLSRCLMPYLNGQDFNDDYQQRSDRHVICFHNFMLQQAEAYPALLGLVRERVKPFRDSVKEKHERENWWLFARYRGEMRYAIKGLERVLVRSRISDTHAVAFVDPNWIFNEKTIVFAFDDWFHFALIQSNMHEMWMRKFSGTLRTDISYAPTDCFETFAFPQSPSTAARAEAERLGEAYHEHRRQTMLARQLGLTKTYNLFHNPQCMDADIARLRELHAAMDRAILACYGWTDLDPAHGFHQNERGQTRYTISPAARRDLLRRLLALNLEIAAREPATT